MAKPIKDRRDEHLKVIRKKQLAKSNEFVNNFMKQEGEHTAHQQAHFDAHSKIIERHETIMENAEDPALNQAKDDQEQKKKETKDRHKAAILDHVSGEKKGSILKILSETLEPRGELAMNSVLLKSEELVDIVAGALEEKLKTNGLPGIMGIEVISGVISFMIDIIPIPGIGLLGLAVQSAGDVGISVLSAVGPKSLVKLVEDSVLPIIEKIAVIFQGLAGSFSCCDKNKRAGKISLSSNKKTELIKYFEELKTALSKIGTKAGRKSHELTKAITDIDAALESLGVENQGNGEKSHNGGYTRRKRRKSSRTRRKSNRKN